MVYSVIFPQLSTVGDRNDLEQSINSKYSQYVRAFDYLVGLGACTDGMNIALIETSIHLYIVCQPGSCGNEAI